MKKHTFFIAMFLLSISNLWGQTNEWAGYWETQYVAGDVSGTFLEDGQTEFGTGTAEDPYLIKSGADLAKLAQKVKTNTYEGKHFKLAVDIDLTEKLWYPIGTGGDPEHPFKGYFDGDNHIISNLKITADAITAADGCGLFGKASNGSIKNLGIKNATISITGNSIQNVGGLIGNCASNVSNCYIDNITITGGMNRISGFIGKCWANSFTNCYAVNVTLDASGTNPRGGLIAEMGGTPNTLTNCYAANVTINNKPAHESEADYLGTLAGKIAENATFINCFSDISLCGTTNGVTFRKGDGTTVTIDNSNKTSNEFIKSTVAFADGEVAYLLNQYPQNSLYWSVSSTHANTVYPCFANETNARIYKLSATAYVGATITELNYSQGKEPITSATINENSITAIHLANDYDIPENEFNSLISKYGNANTLKYMPENSSIIGNNIIKSNSAPIITLTDGVPFYCPVTIDNATVSYSRNFVDGWNTICLPFAYAIANNDEDKIEEMTAGTAESVSFEYVTSNTEANKPYLINIKNTGVKTFNATGVTIPTSDTMNHTSQNGYTFTGIFTPSTVKNGYGLVLDAATNSVMFKKIPENGSAISSFRAYLAGSFNDDGTPSSAPLRIIHGDGESGATNVEKTAEKDIFRMYGGSNCINIVCGKAQVINIYSIDGSLIKTVKLNKGSNSIDGINKGIYLINNQKTVVK